MAINHKDKSEAKGAITPAKHVTGLILAFAGLLSCFALPASTMLFTSAGNEEVWKLSSASNSGDSLTVHTIAEKNLLAQANRVTQRRVSGLCRELPLSFEANCGQADRQVKFISRGNGYALFLTATEAVLELRDGKVIASSSESNNLESAV